MFPQPLDSLIHHNMRVSAPLGAAWSGMGSVIWIAVSFGVTLLKDSMNNSVLRLEPATQPASFLQEAHRKLEVQGRARHACARNIGNRVTSSVWWTHFSCLISQSKKKKSMLVKKCNLHFVIALYSSLQCTDIISRLSWPTLPCIRTKVVWIFIHSFIYSFIHSLTQSFIKWR